MSHFSIHIKCIRSFIPATGCSQLPSLLIKIYPPCGALAVAKLECFSKIIFYSLVSKYFFKYFYHYSLVQSVVFNQLIIFRKKLKLFRHLETLFRCLFHTSLYFSSVFPQLFMLPPDRTLQLYLLVSRNGTRKTKRRSKLVGTWILNEQNCSHGA